MWRRPRVEVEKTRMWRTHDRDAGTFLLFELVLLEWCCLMIVACLMLRGVLPVYVSDLTVSNILTKSFLY